MTTTNHNHNGINRNLFAALIGHVTFAMADFTGCDWETGRTGEDHAAYVEAVEAAAAECQDLGRKAIAALLAGDFAAAEAAACAAADEEGAFGFANAWDPVVSAFEDAAEKL